jgi:hypothetical protein
MSLFGVVVVVSMPVARAQEVLSCLERASYTVIVVLTDCGGVLFAAAAEGQADFPAVVLAGHLVFLSFPWVVFQHSDG